MIRVRLCKVSKGSLTHLDRSSGRKSTTNRHTPHCRKPYDTAVESCVGSWARSWLPALSSCAMRWTPHNSLLSSSSMKFRPFHVISEGNGTCQPAVCIDVPTKGKCVQQALSSESRFTVSILHTIRVPADRIRGGRSPPCHRNSFDRDRRQFHSAESSVTRRLALTYANMTKTDSRLGLMSCPWVFGNLS